jgi:IS30 family transposase
MDDPKLRDFVLTGLVAYWSPEQIAGRLRLLYPDDPSRHISPPTIYAWIAEQGEDRADWESYLRRRGKRRRTREKRGPDDQARSIAGRPETIEHRARPGDFEGDTVLGPPGTGGVVTLVDRQCRYTVVFKIEKKTAAYVRQRIEKRLKPIEADHRRSITFDNGTEFADCHQLESKLGVELYFADPGCPFQRGTNENTNGLLRQFFPKGTDFREVTHHEVREAEELLNNRPRACLGFRTPNEVFHGESAAPNCD